MIVRLDTYRERVESAYRADPTLNALQQTLAEEQEILRAHPSEIAAQMVAETEELIEQCKAKVRTHVVFG